MIKEQSTVSEAINTGTRRDVALQLRLFGPPEIMWNGESLEIPRRQPRAILYHLAALTKPVPRSYLCLLFWPEVPESEARRNLSNQVYNLRRALPNPDVIQTPDDSLTLEKQQAWSDVRLFKRLSLSSQRKDLQQTADLYRGPFLEGFTLLGEGEFSLWVDRERRGLEQTHLENLLALMEIYANQGKYSEAVACARRYLEIDDLAEQVHCRLIDLYAAQGDRSAALRQYERCATILERELGVDPLPQTRDVYLAVLEDRTFQMKQPFTPPTLETIPSLEAPLVGRQEHINKLEKAFIEARSGRGSALLVSGEAGVGKTRLLEEFMTEHLAETNILSSGGNESLGEVSYLPLVEALRPILQKVDWSTLNVDPLHLAQLVSLMPEIRDLSPDLPEPLSAGQDQEKSPLFQAMAHLVLGLAHQYSPLILCLDDLHWIDRTTRSWLGYLGNHLSQAPLLLLCGYRIEESEALEPLRASLARLDVLEEVRLQGLTYGEVEHLIYHLSGQKSGYEHFCHNLHRMTGGNPFFLLETLRSLFESGLLEQDDTGWQGDLDQLSTSFAELSWSDSLTETVIRRVGRLSPTAAQVLQAGSVIGKAFDFEIVKATSGRSELEVIDSLEELAARQLITVDGQRYHFKHDLLRGIVESNLSYGRYQLLHRRAGEVMEQREPTNAAALTHHFSAAGEVQKTVRYALLAGDQARELFALQEAVQFYQSALKLQQETGNLESERQTLLQLGQTYQLANDYSRAHKSFEKSFALRRDTLEAPTFHRPSTTKPLHLSLHSVSQPLHLFVNNHIALDPGRIRTPDTLINQLFSGLLRSGVNWTIEPEVARAWQVSEDGLHYVFHLRDDAVWSDGAPVSAQDFEFAWKRIFNPQINDNLKEKIYKLYPIRGAQAYHSGETNDPDTVAVRAVDPLTLEVDLEAETGHFLSLVTDPLMKPVPWHTFKHYGGAWSEPGHLVTNGPFLLQDWQPGDKLILVRNPTYFGHFQGNLNQVSISQNWLSPTEQLAAYSEGKIDVLALRQETYSARLQYAEDYQQAATAKTFLIGFGRAESPFGDNRVRQALGMAIDRGDFANQTMVGSNIPANGGFLPPGFPGHSSDIGLPYNPGKARRLLAESGYPEGKDFPKVELLSPAARLGYAQALQSIWQQHLGIKIHLKLVGWSDFFNHFQQAQVFIVAWKANSLDLEGYLQYGVKALAGNWRNPDFEKLIQAAKHSKDQSERLRLSQKADCLMVEQAAILPLFYRGDHYLIKPWFNISLQTYSLKDAVLEPH